nr:CatB-related O-acetyltransferase [uncultured Flavobacterium sp.]
MFIKNIVKFFYYLFKSEIVLSKIFRSSHNTVFDKNSKVYSPSSIVNSKIGFGSYIASFSVVNSTVIGKFCSIGPNFLCGYGIHPTNGISTSPIFYSTKNQTGKSFTQKDKIVENKPIFIGNDVFIGANVTVLDGVTINDGAIIGAGAVVVNDIPPYAIAVGVPAKIVKYRFTSDEINCFLKIKWWDWPEDKLTEIEKYFFNIKVFLEKNKKDDSE